MAYELMVQPIIFGGYMPDSKDGTVQPGSRLLQNIKFNLDGGIESVSGYSKFNAYQFKDCAVVDLFQFITNAGTPYLMVHGISFAGGGGSYLYQINSAGTVTYLSGTTNSEPAENFNVLNDVLVISPGVYYWRSGLDKHYSLSAAPNFNYSEVHYDRLFGANTSSDKSIVYWSNSVDPYSWDTTNNLARVNPDDGDVIVGIKSFMGDMYVFKRYACYRITGNNFGVAAGTSNHTITKLAQIPGCINQKSIVVANGKMYWMSYQGAVEWDGSSVPRYIGRGIIDSELRLMTAGAAATIPEPWTAVHDSLNSEIIFAYSSAKASGGGGWTSYTYNYLLKKWSKKVLPSAGNASYALYTNLYTFDTHVVMGGVMSGYIHEWLSGATHFDDSAINAYYYTDWLTLNSPFNEKMDYKLLMECTRGAYQFLSCSDYYDYDIVANYTHEFNLDTNGDLGANQYFEADLEGRTSRSIRLKLAVNSTTLKFAVNKAVLQFKLNQGKV